MFVFHSPRQISVRLVVFWLARMVDWPMSVSYHQPWYLNQQKILSVWLWLWLGTKVWIYRKKWPGSDHVFSLSKNGLSYTLIPNISVLLWVMSGVKRCKIMMESFFVSLLWCGCDTWLSIIPLSNPSPLQLLKVHQPCAGDISQGSQTVMPVWWRKLLPSSCSVFQSISVQLG